SQCGNVAVYRGLSRQTCRCKKWVAFELLPRCSLFGMVNGGARPNSPQKPTSRRMPRPPAEPARSARDGRRHAACRSRSQKLSFLAASGAPLVRSRVCAACSLASDPLGGHDSGGCTFPHPPDALVTFLRANRPVAAVPSAAATVQ